MTARRERNEKAVWSTVLLAVISAAVAVCGVLLCVSLSINEASPDADGWNMLLMLPASASLAVAVSLLLLDAGCIVMLVLLTVSYIRTGIAIKKDGRKKSKPRFSRCAELDGKNAETLSAPYTNDVSLRDFCDGFRNFAASKMRLYYDPSVMRAYVAAMSCTKLIMLQGISGTGKTSLAYAFGKYVGNESSVIPVQPSWKDRSDLVGYYNEFTDSYTETELLYKLYEANLTKDVYTVVLDEMNIARIEYYFAEFLSTLELPASNARRIRITPDRHDGDPRLFENGTLRLPDNMWFVGTANNDDSTLAVSDKVYDRAFVIELDRRSDSFIAKDQEKSHISYDTLTSLFKKAEAELVPMELRSSLSAFEEYMTESLGICFGNRFYKQADCFIPVYVACGGTGSRQPIC